MVNRTRVVVAVALAAAVVAGLLATGVVAAPFKVSVADGGFKFSPKTAHVLKGRKVKWTNKGNMTHTITFYKRPKGAKMSSFSLSPGASKKRKVTKTGVYKYRCMVATHSSLSNGKCTGMCGKIKSP
jgi:plastocyanin